MIVEEQSEAIAFLADPATHGLAAEDVTRIDTHTAVVVLAGNRAFKLKRAAQYPYLDFSTRERRRDFSRREVTLNRRTAPGLYLGIRPIRRGHDGLELGDLDACRSVGGAAAEEAAGDVVDWVVEMRRFDQNTLFDRMADDGRLTPELMRRLADRIHRFHVAAELRQSRRGRETGAALMKEIVDGNNAQLDHWKERFDTDQVARFRSATGTALTASSGRLDARSRDGFVRQCHGDLHLRNICLAAEEEDGPPVPTLFDAIEFNDRFAEIDVLYDLAFLLMDLEHRDLRSLANLVLNRYIAVSRRMDAHIAALPTLALFLSQRAAIRAHVGIDAAANQPDSTEGTDRAERIRAESQAYLDLALSFLAPQRPMLLAIGGLQGTGKSTLAQHLAPSIGVSPGALLLRSDVIRKRLRGVMPETRLGEDAYTPAVTEEVFRLMAERATLALNAGWPVIVDAVFGRPAQRHQIERVAEACGVPFQGIWLETPAAVAERRIAERRSDPSDATVEIARRQRARDSGEIGWTQIDASGSVETVAARTTGLIPGP